MAPERDFGPDSTEPHLPHLASTLSPPSAVPLSLSLLSKSQDCYDRQARAQGRAHAPAELMDQEWNQSVTLVPA